MEIKTSSGLCSSALMGERLLSAGGTHVESSVVSYLTARRHHGSAGPIRDQGQRVATQRKMKRGIHKTNVEISLIVCKRCRCQNANFGGGLIGGLGV